MHVTDVPQRLREELLKIRGPATKPWVDKRMRQIQDYWHLGRYQKGAQAMFEAARKLELTGNFDTLRFLADGVSGVTFNALSLSAWL